MSGRRRGGTAPSAVLTTSPSDPPPRRWRYSHDFHLGNVGKPINSNEIPTLLVTSDFGSFQLVTTQKRQLVSYRQARTRPDSSVWSVGAIWPR